MSPLSDKSPHVYLDVLWRIAPILAIGGLTAIVTHLNTIAQEQSSVRKFMAAVSVVGVGCAAGGCAVLGLSLFTNIHSAELDIVAGAVAGASGQKIFDIYATRIFGSPALPKHFSSSHSPLEEREPPSTPGL